MSDDKPQLRMVRVELVVAVLSTSDADALNFVADNRDGCVTDALTNGEADVFVEVATKLDDVPPELRAAPPYLARVTDPEGLTCEEWVAGNGGDS